MMLESMRGEDGEIVIDDTGDDIIDKWERELAQGLEPDLEEGLSQEEKQRLADERELKKKVRGLAEQSLVNDDYTKPRVDEKEAKRHESKFIPVGSPEDDALLRAASLGRARGTREPELLGGALKRRGR